MTEIRTIVHGEAGEFLRVLCRVFNLDFERATAVFFTEPMFDLRRKWAVVEGGSIVSVLTTTPLQFGWGHAIGIAGVATVPERQGNGYATELLHAALKQASLDGEGAAVLFAQNPSVYARLGFESVDTVVRGKILGPESVELPGELTNHEIRQAYRQWSDADASRLRRDERRWKYWDWGYRSTYRVENGYITVENGLIKEAVGDSPLIFDQLPGAFEWIGLSSLTKSMHVPVHEPRVELNVMTLGFPTAPQMFMTDQF